MDYEKTKAYATKLAYHLGKGIWKGIPVIGSIVEEVVYEAHKDQLSGEIQDKLYGLSEDDVQKLEEMMGSAEDAVREALTDFREDADRIGAKVQESEGRIRADIGTVKRMIDRLQATMDAVGPDSGAGRALQEELDGLQRQRDDWIARISTTQRDLLELLPEGEPGALYADLFTLAQERIPGLRGARVPELHFRLHELRWLGLVERAFGGIGDEGRRRWSYWRTEEGTRLVSGASA